MVAVAVVALRLLALKSCWDKYKSSDAFNSSKHIPLPRSRSVCGISAILLPRSLFILLNVACSESFTVATLIR